MTTRFDLSANQKQNFVIILLTKPNHNHIIPQTTFLVADHFLIKVRDLLYYLNIFDNITFKYLNIFDNSTFKYLNIFDDSTFKYLLEYFSMKSLQ